MLLRIAPNPEDDQPGKTVVHNPCLSGGTLEIFLEPVLPTPLVSVLGDSPIARAMRQVAASLGYELTVDDSTSFGSSLIRQRLSGSVTTPLPAHVFATVSVVGQLDRYPEPQVVARDIAAQSFDSLDGEARSSAAVRLGRGFGRAWQAELRWSVHASALGDAAGTFRRQLVYAGLTWER